MPGKVPAMTEIPKSGEKLIDWFNGEVPAGNVVPVQLSCRGFLHARESPYAFLAVFPKFPQCCY